MSNFYGATSLIGGGSGALDKIDGSDLADLDGALVIVATKTYSYTLDADAGGLESSPIKIIPDSNFGDKRWILTGLVCKDIIFGADNAYDIGIIDASRPRNLYLTGDLIIDYTGVRILKVKGTVASIIDIDRVDNTTSSVFRFLLAGASQWEIGTVGASEDFCFKYQPVGSAFYVTTAMNLGLNQPTFGTNATCTFGILNGVAPTTSIVNSFQLYSADFNAVDTKACAHFREEDGAIIKLAQQHKASYNNWAAFGDVVNALVAMGIFDAA